MASKRPTAKDYRKELQELEEKLQAVSRRVIKRANELIKQYPDVIVGHYSLKEYGEFENYSTNDSLTIIEAVEKHLAALHPHKQTVMEFPSVNVHPAGPVGTSVIISAGRAYSRTPDDICNCDKRDMPVYKEGDKYWCPQCGYEVQ